MKKLLLTLLFLFITYVIYYDLSAGVLSKPTSIVLLQDKESKQSENTAAKAVKEEKTDKQPKGVNTGNEKELYYQEVKVAAGQTVLSIVEQIQDGPLPVSISQLITDFQVLNPKTEPEMIQIGKVYKFPVYTQTKE